METTAIHRIIEQHAALRGENAALVDGQGVLTYRDLNQRANTVARCLISHGFRRGGTAVINMPRSMQLAVVCLGVLKAGGAYAWLDGDATWPHGVSIPQGNSDSEEMKVLAIDVTSALTSRSQSSANLPILTRGSDIACVIDGADGRSVLVPHSTITALVQPAMVPAQTPWSGEPGALDLWVGLMAGATVTMAPESALTAA
jgi:surfactin family lipopeptide synthetase B